MGVRDNLARMILSFNTFKNGITDDQTRGYIQTHRILTRYYISISHFLFQGIMTLSDQLDADDETLDKNSYLYNAFFDAGRVFITASAILLAAHTHTEQETFQGFIREYEAALGGAKKALFDILLHSVKSEQRNVRFSQGDRLEEVIFYKNIPMQDPEEDGAGIANDAWREIIEVKDLPSTVRNKEGVYRACYEHSRFVSSFSRTRSASALAVKPRAVSEAMEVNFYDPVFLQQKTKMEMGLADHIKMMDEMQATLDTLTDEIVPRLKQLAPDEARPIDLQMKIMRYREYHVQHNEYAVKLNIMRADYTRVVSTYLNARAAASQGVATATIVNLSGTIATDASTIPQSTQMFVQESPGQQRPLGGHSYTLSQSNS